jgi:hypothetical protein
MSPEFSVVAIVAAYNEADIIEQVVADLIEQGVHVYIVDDGSTDGTVAAVERYIGHGVLHVEHLAPPGAPSRHAFDLEAIVRRKAQIASELDTDWFINHDADEFRESPWPHLTLRDAIRRVDALGFNAIDFQSLDFWPVDDRFAAGDDVRAAFTHYSEGAAYDRLQIRCWKRTSGTTVDLESSGGHDTQFPGRNVFPVRFISRHYPIRSQAHGERKVFQERRGRFLEKERARGWHVQYDAMQEGASFIRDRSTLTPYDPDAVRIALTLRHRGVEALEASLAEAAAIADTLRRELEQRHHELSRGQGELARRLEEQTRYREEQSRYREEHVRLHAEQSRYREEQARYRKALAQSDAELVRTRAELDARQADIAMLRRDLDTQSAAFAAVRAGLAATGAQLTATRVEITAARDFVEHQSRAIERLQDEVTDGRRRIDDLHRSLSWRMTAPARAALRALRGR